MFWEYSHRHLHTGDRETSSLRSDVCSSLLELMGMRSVTDALKWSISLLG